MAILLSGVVNIMEHTAHELLELAIDFLEAPREMFGILAHLETRNEHAARICRLTRHECNAVLEEVVGRLDGGRHIGALAYDLAAIGHKRLSVFEKQRVFASARKCDVARKLPNATAVLSMPNGIRALVKIHGKRNALVVTRTLLVVNVLEDFVVDALGVLNPAMGIGACEHLATELGNLLDSINRNVAGTVNDDVLAFKGIAVRLQVFIDKVHQSIARSLGASKRSAKREAFAGKHAGPFVANALILAEHIGNFTAANTQVACRHIGVGSDVAAQFSHKRLTEMHDFVVGLALGVEVGTTFATTHGKRGETVFKNLLQAQELQHAERNRGVEAKAALVGANGGVELNAIAAIDLDFS